MVRTHWWLRRYSSHAMEGFKLKSECLFLICLELLFALNCKFWHKSLIFNLLRLQDTLMTYDTRTETKEGRKRTTTTKRYTSDSSNLVEEVTPHILFLDTKPFVFSTISYFKWMHISKRWFSRFFLLFRNETRIFILNWN